MTPIGPARPSPHTGGAQRPSSKPPGALTLAQRIKQWYLLTFGGREFLCDTCKYDYGAACTRPERPNARRCPDFEQR